ncbi:MAG: cytochrome oxidase putative small subunit CydP [Rhodanobacter sp.]
MSSSVVCHSQAADSGPARRPLRRLTFELFAIVALKIVLLTLIWWLLFAPHPKPDASPAAIARLLAPSAHAPAVGHP